jgi:hypothetical protein
MAVSPIVRYMLLCDDWRLDGPNNRRVTIVGLIWNIHSLDEAPYPLFYREFCVFLALTEGRGQGEGHIACVFDETGETVFETGKRPIQFTPDPLEVLGVPFRIRNCTFPKPGRYSVQFWYDGVMLEERPLRMR